MGTNERSSDPRRPTHWCYDAATCEEVWESRTGRYLPARRWMVAALYLLPLCTAVLCAQQEQDVERAAAATIPVTIGDDDADETPEGKQRLKAIENLASKLLKEWEKVERERRPFAMRRDSMLSEAVQARERIPRNQAVAAATERQLVLLENQIRFTPGSLVKELRARQTRMRTNLNTLIRRIDADRKLIDERMTDIQALNPQLVAVGQRLHRLNEQMHECRQQWLAIRQPFQKYSRGDFEGVRRVLDDWLILDGHWPEAYAWAALCAFELDDMNSASAYLEKAQRLHANLAGSKKSSPPLEALTGLIRRKQSSQSGKAETALVNAIRLADKSSDWQTYFLLGRCYLERSDDAIRAKAHFQRALVIQPNCDCARLWLARLQTTSQVAGVRDLDTGTATLEQLWDKSARRSWRLAVFLADAYSASQRLNQAQEMWNQAAELIPVGHKHRLHRYANPSSD